MFDCFYSIGHKYGFIVTTLACIIKKGIKLLRVVVSQPGSLKDKS